MTDDVSDYDYHLPGHLIAQHPLPRRSDARLMLVRRDQQLIEHHHVRDLPDLLAPADCLVFNDSRVVPARLLGRRTLTGGRWEGLFLSEEEQGCWKILGRTRGRLQPGETVTLLNHRGQDDIALTLVDRIEGGGWLVRPPRSESTWELLNRVGHIPLPHYIRRGAMAPGDRERYQTVYARVSGSVAAPTAGLHFTPELLASLRGQGIGTAFVTLHVGLGTFRPIAAASLAEHVMHEEWCELSAESAQLLRAKGDRGGRIVAVGTTATRVLESVTRDGPLRAWSGQTQLFIRPPFEFRAVAGMLTNFHLPRSTLLVLVRTFGGDDLVRRAYAEAVARQYRFYSYGDAMLIL